MKPIISIIIPSLGKKPKQIEQRITEIKKNSALPYEIVLVDGSTTHALKSFGRRKAVIYTTASGIGRGQAMDDGAKLATGKTLIFLHEDTKFKQGMDTAISEAIDKGFIGGACKKIFNQNHWYLTFLIWLSDIRSKKRKIFFGDQLLFTKRITFNAFGGFRGDKLFEDVNLSKRMKQAGSVIYLEDVIVITDASRIMKNFWNYMWITIKLKILYFFRVHPDTLFKIYYK